MSSVKYPFNCGIAPMMLASHAPHYVSDVSKICKWWSISDKPDKPMSSDFVCSGETLCVGDGWLGETSSCWPTLAPRGQADLTERPIARCFWARSVLSDRAPITSDNIETVPAERDVPASDASRFDIDHPGRSIAQTSRLRLRRQTSTTVLPVLVKPGEIRDTRDTCSADAGSSPINLVRFGAIGVWNGPQVINFKR